MARLSTQRVTIFGSVRVQELHQAQDVIFNAPVEVEITVRPDRL